jgi:ferric enterobactin receptor
MKKIFPLLLVILALPVVSVAQRVDHILLDTLYICTMDKALDAIAKRFHVTFAYDREVLSKYDMTERPEKKPLSLFLTQECAARKLKWYIGPDSVIYITEKYENLTSKPVEADRKRSYFGKAQKNNFTLTGIVRDKSSGEALPFANVGIRQTTVGSFTSADGFFTLLNVPSDTATLVVTYIGYKTGYVFLSPDMPFTNLLIEMEPESRSLKEVEVKSSVQEQLMSTNDKISLLKITPQKLASLPNIGEKDVIRTFQLLPGVSAANESSSNLYVRGGTPDQNLLLYDGFTVYQVDHLYGFFSAFNSNAIKDVQLYKGGFEAKYGGRLSSVTEITGKDGNSKGFALGGEISLLSFNAYLELPIGKRFTSLIAFRRSYQGLLYDKIFKQFNETTQVKQVTFGGKGPGGGQSPSSSSDIKSYFYDVNAKFTYKPSKSDILSLSFYNGGDDLDNSMSVSNGPPGGGGGFSFSMNNTDVTKYGNWGAGLRWTRNWNTRLYGTTLVSFSNYYSNRNRSNSGSHAGGPSNEGSFSSGVKEKNNLWDLSFKSEYTYALTSHHLLGFGAYFTDYIISYDFGPGDTSVLKKDQTGTLTGAYLQDKIKLAKSKLTITPGIRLSYFSPTAKLYAEPRLAVSYNISKYIKLIGETGLYDQFANRVVREDFLSGSRDFWILSEKNIIPVSSAWHYIAGISYERKSFLASVEAYYKSIDGITEYSMRFKPDRQGATYAENFFHGTGYATGIEFLVQKKYGALTGWVSYTLGEAKNKIEIYGNNYFPAAQDVTHEFKFVGMYDYRHWSFSLTWLYASGRPYTAPDGAYTVNLLNGTQQVYIDFGAKNASRLPDYHRMDLSVNYKFVGQVSKLEWGSLGLSVFNVYNRRNIWYKEYQIIDGNIIETDKLFLGFTPNITLTLKLSNMKPVEEK